MVLKSVCIRMEHVQVKNCDFKVKYNKEKINNCLSLSLAVEDFLFHEMEIHTRLIVIITFFYLKYCYQTTGVRTSEPFTWES